MSLLRVLGAGNSRHIGRIERTIVNLVAALAALVFLAIAFGIYLNRELSLFLFLGAILVLAFMTTNGGPDRPRRGTPAGWALSVISAACCAYLYLSWSRLELRLPLIDELTVADQAVAIALILLVLEATRRCIGMTLVVLVGLFLVYATFGNHLSGSFSHRGLTLQEMLDHLVFSPNGLFGPALEVAALLVFVFVAFGALLDRWGGGDFFYDLARSLVGRQTGGSAKVAVVSSGLYGSISGSPTADVVTTGSFTIPLMIRTGLTRVRSGAIEAAASTGGAILPPIMGSAAFLMSDFTGIAYGTIVIAAIVPAALYYLAVFLSVHFMAHREGLKPSEADVAGVPPVLAILRRDWVFLPPIALIVWGVISLDRPAFAGAIACLALLPAALRGERNPLRFLSSIYSGLAGASLRIVGVGVACAVAGLVVGTLAMTDLTGKISSGLFALASGNMVLTVVTAVAVIIVLGMGMPTPAVYALAAVLAAPALTSMGVDTLPAHLFIVYFASMSAITPPVAVAAFAAASIAQDNPIKIAAVACRVAFVAFVLPVIFIINPGVMLIGDPVTVAIAVTSSACAVVMLAAAFEGFLVERLSGTARAAAAVIGLMLISPWNWVSLAGAALFVVFIAVMLAARRRELAGRRVA